MQQQLIPITDLEALRAAGIYFKSEGAVRWVERTSEYKGLTEAFVRVGSRIFIDPDKYHELARANNSRGPRAPIAPSKGRAPGPVTKVVSRSAPAPKGRKGLARATAP